MPKVAVILPTFNEERTVGKVIADFKRALPKAKIYVVDGHSKDRTVAIARKAGATIMLQRGKGKGNAMIDAFKKIDADFFITADADDTYPSELAPEMLSKAQSGYDVVVGTRTQKYGPASMMGFHLLGNRLFTLAVNILFGSSFTDILSGYRVVTRDAARRLQLKSSGFQIETEMSVKAHVLGLRTAEVPAYYRSRPPQSESKLNSITDSLRILFKILSLAARLSPLRLFGLAALAVIVLGWIIGVLLF